ncbi:peptidoglycan L-alanyl-D-glutamate endopeptidase precursor [Bacillus phage vB_BpsS-140]|nr:peptidoglycan L-alanyl-D-glutamate endopeptidase precursor [Bacillus phage vB_BpsS-140]
MSVQLATLLERSKRNLGGVHEVIRETTLEVIKRAFAEGIRVQISSGYRSIADQDKLYAQGRTTSGSIVTNARGGQSYHNFGLAVDYFLVSADGKTALWTINAEWRRVATIAKSLGFEWGGDWSSFKDYPHLQMTGGLSLAQLRNGAKPSLTSKVGGSTPAPTPKPSTSHITNAQSFLNSRDYPKAHKGNFTPLVVDGIAGRLTKNATVRVYQYFANVTVDGIFGPNSKRSGRLLREWNGSVWWTSLLQSLLNINGATLNIDGIFGPATKTAVQNYQRSQGLSVDGIVGQNTWTAFLG